MHYQAYIVNNTRKVAYLERDSQMMKLFIDSWKKLPDGEGKDGILEEYELDYYLISKDGENYKLKAVQYLDSIIASKTLAQIREEDKATYEAFKKSRYAASLMGKEKLKQLEKGQLAMDQVDKIKKYGTYYLRFCENKKEYKHLMQWMDYGSTLIPTDYSMDNLRSLYYKKQGKMDKAIKYKELALSKLSDTSIERPTLVNELEQMKKESL